MGWDGLVSRWGPKLVVEGVVEGLGVRVYGG